MHSRYQVINTCLKSKTKPFWSLREILSQLEENDLFISPRTLKGDIEVMRSDNTLRYYAPIEYCPLNRGYHYTDREYSINSINLDDEEIDALLNALNMINKPYGNIYALDKFQSVAAKILCQTDRQRLNRPGSIPEIESVCHIPKAINDRINFLYDAIRKKEAVGIVLNSTPLYDHERNLVLHPYTLSTDHEHWYIIGLRECDQLHIFLQLDWITEVAHTDIPYVPFVYK
jgi:predicted DNA-binding transcriptional regulator YafY